MRRFHPPLVMTVHGIRTHGAWQKTLGEVLSDAQIKHRAFDYGYFSTPRFLWPPARKRKVAEFREWYENKVKECGLDLSDPYGRPSIVAHSFGTYIVAHCMLHHREVRFDKVILCGSILSQKFEWRDLFLKDQVHYVANECGWGDVWAGSVGSFVPATGPSGRTGFKQFDVHYVVDKHFEHFEHSDFFYTTHMRAWVDVLAAPPVDIRVQHGREMANDPQHYEKTLNLTHEIDLQVFGAEPGFDQVDIPRGLALTWIGINNDIYTFLIDQSGAPQGYVNAMPLIDETFAKVLAGTVQDPDITPDDLLPFEAGRPLNIYLMSIALSPDLHKLSDGLFAMPLEKLLYGFVDKLISYVLEKGVVVRRLAAVGWTPRGKKLCRLLGMDRVSEDKFGHPVFELDLLAPGVLDKRLFPGIRKLIEVMRERAEP